MILKAAGVGLLLWLLATLGFRFVGPFVFTPSVSGHPALFVAVPIGLAALTWALVKLLRVTPGDEAEAAIALAFPGMALDVFVTLAFDQAFPDLDPALQGEFGALMLAGYAGMVFTGLLLTRLSPQDQRL